MEALIKMLMSSGQKFIFSCRASQEKVDENASEKSKKSIPHRVVEVVTKTVDENGDTIYEIDSAKVKEAITTLKDTEELDDKDANFIIRENVFLKFLEESERLNMPLYVLAIIHKDFDSLSDLIRAAYKTKSTNEKYFTEIMITNYEIHSFVDTTYKYNYIVYTFEQFLGELLSS